MGVSVARLMQYRFGETQPKRPKEASTQRAPWKRNFFRLVSGWVWGRMRLKNRAKEDIGQTPTTKHAGAFQHVTQSFGFVVGFFLKRRAGEVVVRPKFNRL